MIGCLILGTFGAFMVAKIVRHHLGWAGCHGGGYGHGGGGWHHGPHFGHFHHGHHGDQGHYDGLPGGWDADFAGGGEPAWTERGPRGFGFGRGFFLGAVLDRIQATPVQERTIRAAFEEFRTEAKAVADGEVKRTRQDVSAALRKPSFDEVLLGELYGRHDRSLETVRKSFVGLMAKVHDTLDEEQRARLADLVEKGPRAWRRGFGGRHGLD